MLAPYNGANEEVLRERSATKSDWETALDPDTLSLLSILNFRKTKFDFTYDKRIEHLTISKFVSWIAESTTDKKWKKAISFSTMEC